LMFFCWGWKAPGVVGGGDRMGFLRLAICDVTIKVDFQSESICFPRGINF